MQVTSRSRLQIRLQNIAFVALFLTAIGLLAWLSTRYTYQADWSAGARNTLSEPSRKLLSVLNGPIDITAFATDNTLLRKRITDLVGRYQRYKSDIKLSFVDPNSDPERTRAQGISLDGELLITYRGRSEKLQEHTEQAFSNALQRVSRQAQRWIVFLEGHGERNPHGKANHDLGNFVQELERKGLTIQTVNLAANPLIPQNTSVLVLAGPQVDLLPGEIKLIDDYIEKGGTLLWLADPGNQHGLASIGEHLGVHFLPGVIVDANTQLFGINNPAFALVPDYPNNPITRDLHTLTLFPQAAAIDFKAPPGWQGAEFLTTLPRSWNETGPLTGTLTRDANRDEHAGPLTLGVSLTREVTPRAAPKSPVPHTDSIQQRIAVIGDGDFLSNAYLGNGGNLDLGLSLFNWLAHDDSLVAIPAKTAPDTHLNLSSVSTGIIGLGFLIFLPLLLLTSGVMIWLRRRKR
ncbi:MAG: GldG family protein [Gammaproteobacteria bacterium]